MELFGRISAAILTVMVVGEQTTSVFGCKGNVGRYFEKERN
jgi:hypothetical protein